jgi:hypothetical protein
MVAAAGATDSTPRGPAVDVFIDYDGGATGAPGSTTRGRAIDVWLKTWYLSPTFLLCDTYQGATMANTTTQIGQSFTGKYSLKRAEDPGNITVERFVHQTQDKVIYLQNAWQGREA